MLCIRFCCCIWQYSIGCEPVEADYGGEITLYTETFIVDDGYETTTNFWCNQFNIVFRIFQRYDHILPLIERNCKYTSSFFYPEFVLEAAFGTRGILGHHCFWSLCYIFIVWWYIELQDMSLQATILNNFFIEQHMWNIIF